MKRQRVPTPREVLPSTEVPQQLGAARLTRQCKVIEPQLFEAAAESAMILYFSCDEEAPGARRVTRKIDIALLRIIEPRRKHVDRPTFNPFMKYPEFAPALERLHSEHQRRTLRDELYRGHPHYPVGTAPDEGGGARPVRVLKGNTRLARTPRRRAERQASALRWGQRSGPADGTHSQHRVQIFLPPVIAQVIGTHCEKL